MATLKNKINEDYILAFKGKRDDEISVLKMLKAVIANKEKEREYQLRKSQKAITADFSDEDIANVIAGEVKKMRDSLVLFEKGCRQDLVEKTKNEIDILLKYLPRQLDEEEIGRLVARAIAETGAKEVKDMGKVMGILIPQIKGAADSGMVGKLVRQILEQQ